MEARGFKIVNQNGHYHLSVAAFVNNPGTNDGIPSCKLDFTFTQDNFWVQDSSFQSYPYDYGGNSPACEYAVTDSHLKLISRLRCQQ